MILELPVILSCCREGCDPGVTCDFVMLLCREGCDPRVTCDFVMLLM